MRLLVSSLLAVAASVSVAAPEPALIPAPQDWTVDVRFEHLEQIMLRLSDGSPPQRFWYVILTVTNNTGREVDFYPKCELMTDTFEIIPAGRTTPVEVFENLKRRHKLRYPFLEALNLSGTPVLRGEDNTKDIAIIWPDFDPAAKGEKLFVSGLSNETTAVDNPTARDADGRPTKVLLRKTLELDYSISGDPAFRSQPKLTFKGKTWIMR